MLDTRIVVGVGMGMHDTLASAMVLMNGYSAVVSFEEFREVAEAGFVKFLPNLGEAIRIHAP